MHVQMYAQLMKKQKENSHEGITCSEMGKQNVQAKEVYWSLIIAWWYSFVIH